MDVLANPGNCSDFRAKGIQKTYSTILPQAHGSGEKWNMEVPVGAVIPQVVLAQSTDNLTARTSD